MAIEIVTCAQGTPEWFKVRAGKVTCSELSTVMASGKGGSPSVTRAKYMRRLAGEIITGKPAESYSNGHMERGKEQEPHARERYAFISDDEVQEVGFIINGRKGCSPDGLVGDDGMVEIKAAIPDIQIERLQRGALPSEHRQQCQGALWVAERKWLDFVSFCPGLPTFICRVERDEAYIREISAAVSAFVSELDVLVGEIKAMGAFARAA